MSLVAVSFSLKNLCRVQYACIGKSPPLKERVCVCLGGEEVNERRILKKDGPPPPPRTGPPVQLPFDGSVLKAIWDFGRTVGVRHKTTERGGRPWDFERNFPSPDPAVKVSCPALLRYALSSSTLSRSLTPHCVSVSLIVLYT